MTPSIVKQIHTQKISKTPSVAQLHSVLCSLLEARPDCLSLCHRLETERIEVKTKRNQYTIHSSAPLIKQPGPHLSQSFPTGSCLTCLKCPNFWRPAGTHHSHRPFIQEPPRLRTRWHMARHGKAWDCKEL